MDGQPLTPPAKSLGMKVDAEFPGALCGASRKERWRAAMNRRRMEGRAEPSDSALSISRKRPDDYFLSPICIMGRPGV